MKGGEEEDDGDGDGGDGRTVGWWRWRRGWMVWEETEKEDKEPDGEGMEEEVWHVELWFEIGDPSHLFESQIGSSFLCQLIEESESHGVVIMTLDVNV